MRCSFLASIHVIVLGLAEEVVSFPLQTDRLSATTSRHDITMPKVIPRRAAAAAAAAASKTFWKVRQVRTGMWSTGGVNATFDKRGRKFTRRVGAKGHLFHWAYGFRVDDDGVRRFHLREGRSQDDLEAVELNAESGEIVRAIPFRDMFTRNQLLNKEERTMDGLSPAEVRAEMKKQY
mmetsp:Transcript_8796/g.17965  ORF Transcript_8796/g.17965 Transcript_8796/m.17965 type:complete len:178 (+) Transcript_8796:76-609(+)